MLDTDTKRRIDTCRDILVGKVPDPKSQVEQITIALIYKFMDDMDTEAEELGGDRSFFAGDFEKYGWSKLMAPNMGGFDVLNLYSEAIQKMNENPGIPPLFREIFKNAYLPYRDPETLRIFLKEINSFTYDHSERLGDAFEYLLSVLGSQGEAGQFRTPRHIIDFMVEIIDPKKDETILDPACGTAGFLISSYKHILKHNSRKLPSPSGRGAGDEGEQNGHEAYDEKGVPIESLAIESPLRYKGDLLTPDDRARLANNIKGYDISPDMVRLSLVNMYLHGFTAPHIVEYDTLTSDEKWNEMADIIMANPPFMSPKGGIKPHKRFSVQAKRSEVLFVDYIAEHLTPTGRAAVVVPEGIIFQSGTAYKQLREMLVKNYLVAVISLPGGIFNPYAGVKTSILVMDKRLSKKTDQILFVKIENDGFNLGAQRRPIDENDLPDAAKNIKAWLSSMSAVIPASEARRESLRKKDSGQAGMTETESANKSIDHIRNMSLVPKERIGENGEWNLSGVRYQTIIAHKSNFDLINLGAVCDLIGGGTPAKSNEEYWSNGSVKWISSKYIDDRGDIIGYDLITEKAALESSTGIAPQDSVILITRVSVGKTAYATERYAINQDLTALVPKDKSILDSKYLFLVSKELASIVEKNAQGIGVRGVTRKFLAELKIPLPPIEVQKEIVGEIEGYQKIIDGARQVVENYMPRIQIDPDWPVVELGTICENLDSKRVPITQGARKKGQYPYYGASGVVDYVDGYIFDEGLLLISEDGANLLARTTPIAFSVSGKIWVNNHAHVLRFPDLSTQKYVELYINSISIDTYVTGAAQPKLNQQALNSIQLPFPDMTIRRAIVAQIEEEQRLVNANKELIRIFEEKIKATINRVWGEEDNAKADAAGDGGNGYQPVKSETSLAAEEKAEYGK